MEFYREGFLNKAGKGLIQTHLHSWRPRYFVLNGSQLKYYKCKEQLDENMLGCIEISEIESVGVMKNENKAFQITTNPPKSRTYYMSGKSEEEVEVWVKCITMAQSKYREKELNKEKVSSVYDEVNLPSKNPSPPDKPPRSSNTPPSSSPGSSAGTQLIPSHYALLGATAVASQVNSDIKLEQDPTYDTINDNDARKNNIKAKCADAVTGLYNEVSPNPNKEEPIADLYDIVTPVSIKNTSSKTSSRVSDPLPHPVMVPPPLPARLPSMSGETSQGHKTENKDQATSSSLYDEISTVEENQSSEIQISPQTNVIGLYAELNRTVDKDETLHNKENMLSVALYDEVETTIPSKDCGKNELASKVPIIHHVYAKPNKEKKTGGGLLEVKAISRSMKKNQSKRKLMPGLMDVGEVEAEVEEDAAAGRERLERGMTKPMGDRFAIEDLRDALAEFDLETNNNKKDVFVDFDLNQSESAFDMLRLFLEKYD